MDAGLGRVLDPPPPVIVEPLLDEVYDLPEGKDEVQDLLLRQVEDSTHFIESPRTA